MATSSRAAQNRAVGLATTGPGSLLRSADGRVLVEVRTADTSGATLAALARTGTVEGVSAEYRTTTLAMAPTQLGALARVPGLESAAEILTPVTAGAPPARVAPSGAAPAAAHAAPTAPTFPKPAPCGATTSQADTQLNAKLARNTYGVDGTGQRVGLLSDSYNLLGGASADVASGDLPGPGNPCGRTTPVQVLDDSSSNGADEGRAMAQLVHDVAPGAALKFATAFTGDLNFAANITALKAAGATVIADDVTYFDEPFYQDGPISNAVTAATADGRTSYFSSAANSNLIVGGKDVGSYESAAYRPVPCPKGLTPPPLDCHDFNKTAGVTKSDRFTVDAFGTLSLDFQYAEPWYGVTDNFDLFVVDATTHAILASGTDDNLVTQKPFEFAQWINFSSTPTDVQVIVARRSGTGTPRFKFVTIGSDGITAVQFTKSGGGDTVGPTIFGHNGAANTASVAAVPSTSTTTPETYSSRGPVTLLFGPVKGTTPSAPLAKPRRLAKPDITATDCVSNTFFSFGTFCGTSAAAPHAAAVAALMRDRSPTISTSALLATMKSTATAMSGGTPQSVGSGLVNAAAAVLATRGGLFTDFADPGISNETAMTTGPDGTVWFANYYNVNTIGRITPDGVVTVFPADARIQYVYDMAAGPDGAVWFLTTNLNTNVSSVGRITTAGVVTIYTDPSVQMPRHIVAGPDGAMWFTNYFPSSIGRITTGATPSITAYSDPTINAPNGITVGPDGALWFTNVGPSNGSIGRITTAGAVTSYGLGPVQGPIGIATGTDGNLWFTQSYQDSIGRISPAGVLLSSVFDPTISHADTIVAGPDGALWFVNQGSTGSVSDSSIGRVDTNGAVTNYTDPATAYILPDITAGPDGNVWFTGWGNATIARVTIEPRPARSTYPDPSIVLPVEIAQGADGASWFTNSNNTIGRVTAAGVVTNFADPSITGPQGIALGPDGAMWFANTNSVGRITKTGVVTTYTDPTVSSAVDIALGPDGAMWFTNYGNSSIGRITKNGTITNYTGTGISGPQGITRGPDGAMWFVNYDNSSIGRITTDASHTVTNYTGAGIASPFAITAGPDGALWFTNYGNSTIGRITTDPLPVVTNYTGPNVFGPSDITTGPDGALWFTNFDGSSIGRVTTGDSPAFTDYTAAGISEAWGIAMGSDGALWFTNYAGGSVGRIAP